MSSFSARKVAITVLVLAGAGYALWRSGVWSDWNARADGDAIVLSGNIEAHQSVLSVKGIQSRIVTLPFDEGQSVRQGTVLATLDSADLQQQVEVANASVALQRAQHDAQQANLLAARRQLDADRAALAQRQRDWQRASQLHTQGFVATAAVDNAQTALTEAQAALARDQALEQVAVRNLAVGQAGIHSAQQSLALSRITQGYATLTAPFDGVILVRQAERGEVVAPGTPVLTLADLDHVWMRAYLNETDLGRTKLGQVASISSDSLAQRKLSGRVSFIASEAEYTPKSVETHAERVTRVYRIKIDLDNPDHLLLPGMPVDARLTPAP